MGSHQKIASPGTEHSYSTTTSSRHQFARVSESVSPSFFIFSIRRGIHVQISSLELVPIELFQRPVAIGLISHGDKAKSTRTSRFVVEDQADIANGPHGLKDLVEIILGALEGNVPDVHLIRSIVLGMTTLLDILIDAFQVALRHGNHFKSLVHRRQAFSGLEPRVVANGAMHAAGVSDLFKQTSMVKVASIRDLVKRRKKQKEKKIATRERGNHRIGVGMVPFR